MLGGNPDGYAGDGDNKASIRALQRGRDGEMNRIYKRSLFARLLVWMLVMTTIPFILSNVISYRSNYRTLQEHSIELNQNTMTIGMDNMKKYLQELNLLSVSWYADPDFARYVWKNMTRFERNMYIQRKLNETYSRRPEIKMVNFYDRGTGQHFQLDNLMGNDRWQTVLPPANEKEWDSVANYETKQLGNERFLAFHKKLIDYPNSTVIGLLSIYVSLDELERLNRQLFDSASETMFLFVDRNNQMLYSSASELKQLDSMDTIATDPSKSKGYSFGKLNGKSGVYVYIRDQYLGVPLTSLKFISAAAINKVARNTLNQTIAIQAAAVACVILFALLLSYSITVPIKRLVHNVSRVGIGMFDGVKFNAREDEIGILEQRFESMVHNLKEMIIKDYQQKLEVSTARLKMLQAQINPHFLYNTLQSISTLALRYRAEEINDRISELGFILRYSMDMKTEIVPLGKEVEHIEHYLSLQENRFKNKLSYRISCESEAENVTVPKMILQPLVENSIIHGIENGIGAGFIHVDIALNSGLTIRIVDNGKGLEDGTIELLKKRYAIHHVQDWEGGGIGLMNVLQRLWIRYGDSFEWQISSVPYDKTEITLTIPLEEAIQNETIDCGR
ncbi:sensor histidine kinase [Cohnella terricola]|uniref:HAMP domain-containing protein n=1 Tax=Cohnella terricola TaxID=1289167 RepID=A0A559J9W9_9BACL|nr:histidine kinase [Cohnella terricola]TVX96688.1 HAMP domain-containing protein [Cohnella terricola]